MTKSKKKVRSVKQVIMLLDEQNFLDNSGKPIKDIVGITTFRDGIVLLTKHAVYSNIQISKEWNLVPLKG